MLIDLLGRRAFAVREVPAVVERAERDARAIELGEKNLGVRLYGMKMTDELLGAGGVFGQQSDCLPGLPPYPMQVGIRAIDRVFGSLRKVALIGTALRIPPAPVKFITQ